MSMKSVKHFSDAPLHSWRGFTLLQGFTTFPRSIPFWEALIWADRARPTHPPAIRGSDRGNSAPSRGSQASSQPLAPLLPSILAREDAHPWENASRVPGTRAGGPTTRNSLIFLFYFT